MGDRDEKTRGRFRIAPDGTATLDEPLEEDLDSPDLESDLAEMTFTTHVLSLNAMALMHLGELGGIEERERDVESARHVVDTLAMLVSKTAGNLNAEEERFLKAILYELRMKCLPQAR